MDFSWSLAIFIPFFFKIFSFFFLLIFLLFTLSWFPLPFNTPLLPFIYLCIIFFSPLIYLLAPPSLYLPLPFFSSLYPSHCMSFHFKEFKSHELSLSQNIHFISISIVFIILIYSSIKLFTSFSINSDLFSPHDFDRMIAKPMRHLFQNESPHLKLSSIQLSYHLIHSFLFPTSFPIIALIWIKTIRNYQLSFH